MEKAIEVKGLRKSFKTTEVLKGDERCLENEALIRMDLLRENDVNVLVFSEAAR